MVSLSTIPAGTRALPPSALAPPPPLPGQEAVGVSRSGAAEAKAQQPSVAGDGRSPTPPLSGGTLLQAQGGSARASDKDTAPGELSEKEQAQVARLKERDAEVRRHEEAHARVGGPYAGSPRYSYESGPDGKRYAVGGEVPIDISPVEGDPKATIAKMDVVKRAALAPEQPSSQDRKVAAQADMTRLQAQSELIKQANDEAAPDTEQSGGDERLSVPGANPAGTPSPSSEGIQTAQDGENTRRNALGDEARDQTARGEPAIRTGTAFSGYAAYQTGLSQTGASNEAARRDPGERLALVA